MRAILRLLDEWFLFDTRRRLPWWRLALYLGIVIGAAAWMETGALTARLPFTTDGHAIVSLDLAISASVCGRRNDWNQRDHPANFLSKNEWASYVPVRDVVANVAGSIERYCGYPRVPYANEDHALGLLDEAALRLLPQASTETVGRFLLAVRVAMLAAGCLALLMFGGSVVFTGAVAVMSLVIFRDLHQYGTDYSGNAFFFLLVFLNAATACALVWVAQRKGTRWILVLAAAIGFVAAACVNMRTSYLPIYLAFFVVAWSAVWLVRRTDPHRWRQLALIPCAYFAGYFLFQYPFITRPAPKVGVATNTYHTFWHPLVLGLALPNNDLAKSEGINWVDELGLPIARRIDPNVTFLGPGYERALSTYYKQLWRKYPDGMKEIYLAKAKLAGVHMIQSGNFIDAWMRPAMWPLSWIENGLWLFTVFFGSFVLAAGVFSWKKSPLALYIGLLCLGGAMLWLESAIIVPYYYVQYHSYLLFITLFWCFLVYQLALNGVITGLVWTGRGVTALVRRWSR